MSPRNVTIVEAASWHQRAGGNPFFVVELARLGDTGDDVPVSVREVVGRRFEGLPPRAVDTLRFAAALGRWFRAEVLAAAAARDVDEVLDDLEVARSVGLVEEDESGEFAFAHALTRDAVLRTVPPNRRARLHAELARVLESDPEVRRWYDEAELTADLALQWLAAGPSHANRAWPAARAAADLSHALSSYRDAMDLRRAAVEAHRRAAGPDETERYALLLELAREASYAAQWPEVVDASFEAMALARSIGSPEGVAEAAAGLTTYVVWTPHDWLEVFEDAIDDLRWALATLPEDDSVARCRLLLALAVELYYDVGAIAERRALVEAGLALARRLGDPAVLWWATRAAYIASWAPSFTPARIGWGEEGLAAARESGDRAAEAVTLVCLANDHLELGRMEQWERLSAEAAALAERERLPYVLFTLRLGRVDPGSAARTPGGAGPSARADRRGRAGRGGAQHRADGPGDGGDLPDVGARAEPVRRAAADDGRDVTDVARLDARPARSGGRPGRRPSEPREPAVRRAARVLAEPDDGVLRGRGREHGRRCRPGPAGPRHHASLPRAQLAGRRRCGLRTRRRVPRPRRRHRW